MAQEWVCDSLASEAKGKESDWGILGNGFFLIRKRPRRRHFLSLSVHLVVCGWNLDMRQPSHYQQEFKSTQGARQSQEILREAGPEPWGTQPGQASPPLDSLYLQQQIHFLLEPECSVPCTWNHWSEVMEREQHRERQGPHEFLQGQVSS